MTLGRRPKRRAPAWLVPEVVQTSGMDCGPASLKCMLEGFGIPVSYGRLREACQTDVDGTSIDTIEVVARQLGLDAEQALVPEDHLLLPVAANLPAMVVVRLPNGFTHFLVVWRRFGDWLQVMDPASGRRLMRCDKLQRELYRHTQSVPAEAWREWAGSEENLAALRLRLRRIGLDAAGVEQLLAEACADPGYLGLASLDAALRMTAALVGSGAFRKGQEARNLLVRLREDRDEAQLLERIPAVYWSAKPTPGEPGALDFSGAVLIRVRGARSQPPDAAEEIPAELLAALNEQPAHPLRLLGRMLREDGALAPLVMVTAVVFSGAAAMLEAMLMRGLLDLGSSLGLGWQRVLGAIALVLFFALITAIHFPTFQVILTIGRHLELRLRRSFLEKLPHIGDRYFHSRPRSDMASRSHSLMEVRKLPLQAGRLVLGITETLVITWAVIWLFPAGATLALALSASALLLPLLAHPLLLEIDMRVRTHQGALGKFYLDGLLGLVPLRAHVAEPAMRHQHERLVAEWVRARLDHTRVSTIFNTLRLLLTSGLAVALVFRFQAHQQDTASALLMIYWVLRLPQLGQFTADLALQYPGHRNTLLRLMEPLSSPDETSVNLSAPLALGAGVGGIRLEVRSGTVRAAGHQILEQLDLTVEPGEHVAIVGPSGAGKSSLVGLLLGWHRLAAGQMLIDGQELDGEQLERLRHQTAWVDPEIQIWNRSFHENLTFGHDPEQPLTEVLRGADLMALLEKMPEGLRTCLGEGGSLVSGGEGQRVRLGRAMLRADARCAILDEPFRGLDRATRHALLVRARTLWSKATLFCVTHDISETLAFARVLVIEHGRLVEDGAPQELAQRADSVYARMLSAERDAYEQVWGDPGWRHLNLERGELVEKAEARHA